VSWIGSTSSVACYYVHRGTQTGGPYMTLNSTPVTTTQYTDTSVQSGQTYFYVVTSVDSKNVQSTYTNEVSATIPTP
jgi:fibronectin type 3 domain-containing protein